LWQIWEPQLQPPEPTRAILRSSTDALGRIDIPHCLMGSIGFSKWRLNPELLRLLLLVVHEGYGSRRIVLTVPAAEVLGASQASLFGFG
jgi:hypothetical protein